jgi:hypothetical protein
LVFIDKGSEATQKVILIKHLLHKIHLLSCQNEGFKRGKASQMSMDRFARPVISDLEAVGGLIRLEYTLIRQGVPFCKHLYILRAHFSWSADEFAKRIGHVSHGSIAQILRLISNNLWGTIDFWLEVLKYIAVELDDGSDCTQNSHLLVFNKFYWPPPSNALPSGLPVRRTSLYFEQNVAAAAKCVDCGRANVREFTTCSNGHATCAECVKKMVCGVYIPC